uniref:NADH-ubiquinone oxidoreductase chain 2 n=1 Tax=Pseudabris przewalskyi TaxID=3047135 RepID=A0AA51NHK8_9CUCU|nr:NADH dehydrogenase subunit 2 [Pseudabris przewalskyi]WMQ52475.1 NADH dehydrogenase subunit 2 [Pseudabris przewalskyi]
MLKLYKILFFNTMILGTLIAISSYTWLGMWMGLEINLLSIIPLMSSSKNMFASEASLKYFITQSMASLILLLSIILMLVSTEFITPMMNPALETLLNSALLTKLGAAPFHYWFPEIMEGLNWFNCSILLTWQKIAPMSLLMNNWLQVNFMTFIILASLSVSILMSFNQVSLRKIMAFSSINHIAWMIAAFMASASAWFIYILIYIVITLNITLIFNYGKLLFINQLPLFFKQNKITKLSLMINFLSLGGLPPFLGFLPKWITINWLVLSKHSILAFILIIFTLVMLYIYVRILMSSLVIQHNETKISMQNIGVFPAFMLNFISLSSLLSCTFLFNLI